VQPANSKAHSTAQEEIRAVKRTMSPFPNDFVKRTPLGFNQLNAPKLCHALPPNWRKMRFGQQVA
jgi:hypothetical protein